jgi:hypothetical protein
LMKARILFPAIAKAAVTQMERGAFQ